MTRGASLLVSLGLFLSAAAFACGPKGLPPGPPPEYEDDPVAGAQPTASSPTEAAPQPPPAGASAPAAPAPALADAGADR